MIASYLTCCLATHKHVHIGSRLSAIAEQCVCGRCILSANTQSRVPLANEFWQYSGNVKLTYVSIGHLPKLVIWDDALDKDVVTAREHNKVAVWQTTDKQLCLHLVVVLVRSFQAHYSITVLLQSELRVVSSIPHWATSLAVWALHFHHSSAVTTALDDCIRRRS